MFNYFYIEYTPKFIVEVAIYAGVPLICIPFNGDQPYNSAIVENLEIGMWVEREKIGEQIGEALIEILKKKKYTKAARELRNKILKLPPRKHIFLEKIAEAIKEN
uniref:glucuronosyltransferase n=1 Tax=Meloidogyne hapla TaxID=6305 RepID=A0A1I8BGJ0_MELHA